MENSRNEKQERMQALVQKLNEACDAYYNTGTERMPDREYDALYGQLEALEMELGICLSDSPTQQVGYRVSEKLPKEAHEVPALSLDKTKEISQLEAFLKEKEGILSWKLDGLTVVLTYQGGSLVKAVTRGNGQVGEVITDNAKMFKGLPLRIPDTGKLVVRGEALITYSDFERVNQALPEGEEPYKNPRNLCSGSVRQLDPGKTKQRNVHFLAFALVTASQSFTSRKSQLSYLASQGFETVQNWRVASDMLAEAVRGLEKQVPALPYPTDGLVLQYDDIAYGESLGATSKYPRDAMAFKWADEAVATRLRKLEWSPSRTGLINPVAVFDPVELEGTTVTRASVHNVSIVRGLHLHPGDTIEVYKANMIIPQVAANLTQGDGDVDIPAVCPVCGHPTEIRSQAGDTLTLWCGNGACPAKHVGAFTHAAKRDALNIEGLSEETIRRLMDAGLLRELPDLFHLKEKEEQFVQLEGFGQKSFQKLTDAIEQARRTTLQKLVYALGIDNVGRTASRLICGHFGSRVESVVCASKEALLEIPDIGDVIATSFTEWFGNQQNQEIFEALLQEVILEGPKAPAEGTSLAGKTYVVTGSLNRFPNRDALKARIEALGGKVSGSVSKKTAALINNDLASMSGKNKKAKELGIPILDEDTFLAQTGIQP